MAQGIRRFWTSRRPPGSNGRKTQEPLESSAIVGTVAIRGTADFFCSALPAHIARPTPHRSSQFSRPAFFCRSFFWALLQANSCVLQLRVFCFPGSALTQRVPSHKAAARLGSRSPRFWVPQKMGQKKETFSCPTYMLSGIASGVVCSPAV